MPYEFGVKVPTTTTREEGPAVLDDVSPEEAIAGRGYKSLAIDGVNV